MMTNRKFIRKSDESLPNCIQKYRVTMCVLLCMLPNEWLQKPPSNSVTVAQRNQLNTFHTFLWSSLQKSLNVWTHQQSCTKVLSLRKMQLDDTDLRVLEICDGFICSAQFVMKTITIFRIYFFCNNQFLVLLQAMPYCWYVPAICFDLFFIFVCSVCVKVCLLYYIHLEIEVSNANKCLYVCALSCVSKTQLPCNIWHTGCKSYLVLGENVMRPPCALRYLSNSLWGAKDGDE